MNTQKNKQTDDFQWWREALNGNFGSIYENDPMCGYYRKRKFKNGPFEPVAIWKDGEKLVALIGDKEIDPLDVWTWVCQHPVSYEDYKNAFETGEWADAPAPSNNIGHNSGAYSPFEELSMEFQDDAKQANELLKTPIETDKQADVVAVWSKRLTAIAKRASDLHKVEKQPHLDAGRAVDDKWRDLKEEPKICSDKLKKHLNSWLLKKAAEEQERQRQAREAAEKLRLEAEQLAKQQTEEQSNTQIELLNKQADMVEKNAKANNASAGRTGAKVSLRTFVSAKITDYDKALIALKDHPEMKSLVEQLANRAIRAGLELDGVERFEEQRAA